ncbi:MAG: hypothetical protein WCJ14_07360 [Verrucomicrobiota bacterium]
MPSRRTSFTRLPEGIIIVTSEAASVTWTSALSVTLSGSCSGVRLAGSIAGRSVATAWPVVRAGAGGLRPVTWKRSDGSIL